MQTFLKLSCILLLLCLKSATALAEDVHKWPALPLLEIKTDGGVMPENNVVYAPEGYIGVSTKNEYVSGRLVMTLAGDTLYDSGEYEEKQSGMRIKIRGNSTGANLEQHPYKIKLTKKADLLMRDDKKYKHKEWVLLSIHTWNPQLTNSETNISTWLGNMLSRAVGMSWTPSTEFVNVVLNGQYQGFYTLTECVADGAGRLDVEDTGYIIEHDIFFWNEDGCYFQTEHQNPAFGYTWKYPDADEVTPLQQEYICTYINDFEEKLFAGEEVDEYIDYTSWAKWVLVHDILGAYDAGGTNRYLLKRNYIPENPTATKLEMCALWDFDSSFRCEANVFSVIHTADFYYYKYLFELPNFRRTYISIYDSLMQSGFSETIHANLEELRAKYTDVFEESAALHRELYPKECRNRLNAQVDEMLNRFDERMAALAVNVDALREHTNSIEDIPMKRGKTLIFDVNGRSYTPELLKDLPRGLYIELDEYKRTRKFYKK